VNKEFAGVQCRHLEKNGKKVDGRDVLLGVEFFTLVTHLPKGVTWDGFAEREFDFF